MTKTRLAITAFFLLLVLGQAFAVSSSEWVVHFWRDFPAEEPNPVERYFAQYDDRAIDFNRYVASYDSKTSESQEYYGAKHNSLQSERFVADYDNRVVDDERFYAPADKRASTIYFSDANLDIIKMSEATVAQTKPLYLTIALIICGLLCVTLFIYGVRKK